MVRRSSHQIYCSPRQKPAVISVVERIAACGRVRFVLWCSLRGGGSCDELCLGAMEPSDPPCDGSPLAAVAATPKQGSARG